MGHPASCSVLLLALAAPAGAAAPLPDVASQLEAELRYLTASSWTRANPSSSGWSWFDPTDAIRGAINDIRVPPSAPPPHAAWVEPAI